MTRKCKALRVLCVSYDLEQPDYPYSVLDIGHQNISMSSDATFKNLKKKIGCKIDDGRLLF